MLFFSYLRWFGYTPYSSYLYTAAAILELLLLTLAAKKAKFQMSQQKFKSYAWLMSNDNLL